MTPLRFRAWLPAYSEMREFELLSCADIDSIRDYNAVVGKIHDTAKIMQSTGLKDKNGKEMFEGDVVKWGAWNIKSSMARHEKMKKINVVVWNQKKGSWQTNHDDVWEVGIYSDIEVIGNRFENPDLLPKA